MQLDTLTISERLHKAGLPQKVAKEWAGIWHEDVTGRLATKEDLERIDDRMERLEEKMESMEERIDQRLESMEVRLENRMLRHTYSAVGVLGLLMIVLRFIDPLKTLVSG